MNTLWQDLRYAARRLLKTPGFTLITILTLALGIGANTGMFTVINAVVLRPLPYHDPDRLIAIRETKLPETPDSQVSPAAFLAWQKQSTAFTQIEAVTVKYFNLTGADNPERVRGMPATYGFLPMLGIQPMIGRGFRPDEDRPGHNRVAILSHDLWQRRYGGDPGIVSQTITLDNQSYTVIGVMPPNAGLRFNEDGVWVPMAITAEQSQQYGSRYLMACGRLKPNVTLDEASREMRLIADHLAKQYPDSNTGWNVRAVPLLKIAAEQVGPTLTLMLGAVAFVLLIACANVANLLMARAAARRKELALRAVLGAGRWRIVRQLLVESLLLSIVGGIAGAALADWGVKILMATPLLGVYRIRAIDLSPDGRMLAFNLAAVFLSGCVAGIVPAWQASRPDMNEILKDAGRGSTSGRRQRSIGNALVVIQVAMSVVLLIGTGLMIRSFIRLQQADRGLNPSHVRTIALSLPKDKYREKDQQAAFYTRLIERVAALPGVEVAGATCTTPFGYSQWGDFEAAFKILNQSFRIEGRAPSEPGREPHADYSSVSTDYFRALGIPLMRGRLFTGQDTKETARVAIINQTMAGKFFPNEDPIGNRLYLSHDPESSLEIIGIVGDVKAHRLDHETPAQVYEPYLQAPFPFMTLVVRTIGDPTGLNESIRKEVFNLDPEQPVISIDQLDQLVAGATAPLWSLMVILGAFAAMAMTLAAIGLYGVISYAVTQRTPEIGIRMALGAQARDVLRLIVRQGLVLTLAGLILGLLMALGLTRLLSGWLFEVGANDPLTFTAIALVLTLVALLACWIPARRAARVDPMTALRCE